MPLGRKITSVVPTPDVNPEMVDAVAAAIQAASGNCPGLALAELRGNVVDQYRTQARAALSAFGASDVVAGLISELISLRATAAHAAELLVGSADMLSHLVMDTAEDQALNDGVIEVHRHAAAAIRKAAALDR